MNDVTVVIPTIPPRARYLRRALKSISNQTKPAYAVAIAQDVDHDGAWVTRNRALAMVTTEWVAFLDDDDEFLPNHLELLLKTARVSQADMVWGWFQVAGGQDPFPHYRGRQYDIANPHVVPITYLARREMLMNGPGFQPDKIGAWESQDQPIVDHMFKVGKLFAIPDITWVWHHHGMSAPGISGNTSGKRDSW